MISILLITLIIPLTARAESYQPGVVLSFDDFYIDQWHDYFAGRNDVKATFFASHWDTYTPEMIQKLKQLENKGHEVGFHTRSHKGVASHFGSDPARIQEYLDDQIITTLDQMKNAGFNPKSFSYPFGEHTDAYDTALKDYFPYLRSTYADVSKPLSELDENYHNQAKNYSYLSGDGIDKIYQNDLTEIENALARAKTNGEILTLYAHEILADNETDNEYGINISKLNGVINKAKQLGLKFYTFEEAYLAGNKGSVNTTVVANSIVQLSWNNIANDFIGIVPAEKNQWEQGMPSITTDGNISGSTEIMVPNPLNKQEYVAIFYKNNIKVFTTTPFVILDSNAATQPPEILSPKGITQRQANGSVLLKWKAVLGAASYDYDGYQTTADGTIKWDKSIFEKNISAADAGCSDGGTCRVTETVTSHYGVWEVRANIEGVETDYSDYVEFSLTTAGPDTTAPVITLNGTSPVFVAKGTTYTDAGATATDNIDPTVTVIIDDSAVNTSVAKTYTVQFKATDSTGNVAHATRSVTVKVRKSLPLLPPEIISPLDGSTTTTQHVVFSWKAAPGADSYGIEALKASVSGDIKWGKFIFDTTISATEAGCATSETCQITKTIAAKYAVWTIRANRDGEDSEYTDYTFFSIKKDSGPDTIAPVITLTGSKSVTIKLGTPYVDAGATATDNVDGSVTVAIDSQAVEVAIVGTYEVQFSATDHAGNIAHTTRTVVVSESIQVPLTPPEIISPTDGSTSQTQQVVFSWKAITGADSYGLEALSASADGDIKWDEYIFDTTISATDAGCATSNVCKTTQTVSNKHAVWTIRTNREGNASEYSDYLFFSVDSSITPPTQTVRIMPLGDSITEGIDGHPSYRRALWHSLQQGGYNVDFVGNTNNLNSELNDFDLDHEGHSGWEAGEIDRDLNQWLTTINPDIVMLHVGTNDLTNGQDDASTLQEISSIINKLRVKNSSVVILLAKIIPMRHYDTATFNSQIDQFVADRNSEQSPIVVVDQYTGYDAELDSFDNYHPNASGEEKIARKWMTALQSFLPTP